LSEDKSFSKAVFGPEAGDRVLLGIETSCDETAAAVVLNGRKVLSSKLFSQIQVHQEFGGVVPEVAARKHVEILNSIVEEALSEAGVAPSDLSGIVCTAGPGLIGTLLVGLAAAKAYSWAWERPFIAVDHLLSHVCANYIDTDLEPPFVALLVSGGHTQLLHFEDYRTSKILGQTLDDAAGEAFDKVGRLLGLEYPGGPVIDQLALLGNAKAYAFPEGVVDGYDFSFSGLKTAVLRAVEKSLPPIPVADLAASFQAAAVKVLVKKTLKAAHDLDVPRIVLAGGVAANRQLRAELTRQSSVPVYIPQLRYCTDNAAMVAAAGFYFNEASSYEVNAYSRQKHPKTLARRSKTAPAQR
jgi:N6-L-threonylcarbamoyladenine synthase